MHARTEMFSKNCTVYAIISRLVLFVELHVVYSTRHCLVRQIDIKQSVFVSNDVGSIKNIINLQMSLMQEFKSFFVPKVNPIRVSDNFVYL